MEGTITDSGSETLQGFPGGSVGQNLPASAGDTGDTGLIPGWGRSRGEAMATHSSILAWRVAWAEEPGGQQFMGSPRVRHDWPTERTGTRDPAVLFFARSINSA